ncbi:MAG: hypothetical protein DF168_01198 [Candidatus Moanabacter tarae]|uniref:Amidohydrolase-related domain-containing protein n=1 Tax=Candidatus Moanibacter tarae TaxID=2200854 RepID=A0A2Z4ACV3_9BACT|nr:MAG: hypothetical protein DF168_01198 [Candidatus Moanabacter tarae]|tara:strand:+ start:9338 stop:10237 length:900 start_codon:yes stop_codon:yes gene_type:complete
MIKYSTPERPYIDMHHHFGRTINRAPMVGVNLPMALARNAATNTVASISMPVATGSPILNGMADIRAINEMASGARAAFPKTFPLVLGISEVRFGESGLDELDRAFRELALDGFVDHPPFNESSLPFIEVAAAYGGLCNLHCHTPLMGRIARSFPGLTFIVHASTYATEHLSDLENLVFEVVQFPDGRGTKWDFHDLANAVGQDRIIYGADQPYYDFRHLQNEIEAAPISDDLKDRIAWKNAEMLIQRFWPEWQMPSKPEEAPRVYDPEILWAVNPEMEDRLTVDVIRGPVDVSAIIQK